MKQKTYLILALALLMSTGLAFQSLAQGCSDLFFSEYVEGTSFEKYIEIITPHPVRLTCRITNCGFIPMVRPRHHKPCP